jgi:hypothetical protein
MKRKYNISNLNELNEHLLKLHVDFKLQETELKTDTQEYLKQFKPANLFKKHVNKENIIEADHQLNLTSKVMSLAMPFLVNNTLFPGSGILTKFLVGMVSNQVGKKIDAGSISKAFSAVKGLFKSKKKKPLLLNSGAKTLV